MTHKQKRNQHQHQILINLIHSTMSLKGWTLAEVAKHLGISHVYMASLSNGARKLSGLDIEKQRILAKLLGISMVEFFLYCGLLRQEDLIPR